MSHTDEIAKQDSIRVKITWRVGDAKHEVEYDARAIEMKRNSTLNYYKTWTLTLLETPRFFNVEEGPPSTPALERTPPVPATCCGHAPHTGFRCSRCACEGRTYATESPATYRHTIIQHYPDPGSIFLGFDRETEQLRAVNEELRGAIERAAPIFAAPNHEPRNPR